VPYKIKGIAVKNAVSFYYLSGYSMHDPKRRAVACADLRRDDCRIPANGSP